MDFSIFKYAYAISGGIGSGKSVVCEILQSRGYALIDADKIAHQALECQKEKVVLEFGKEILDQEGKIQRKKLGQIVFACKQKLQILENLLDTYIIAEMFSQCQALEAKQKIFFVEIPLLFEKSAMFDFRHKILIATSKELQIQRVMQRDHLNQKEALQRIEAQMPVEQKRALATEVIENLGSLEELENKVLKWLCLL